jgi:hypothetical protein
MMVEDLVSGYPSRIAPAGAPAATAFLEYFRCPDEFAQIDTAKDLSDGEGYFSYDDTIGYGRLRGAPPPLDVTNATRVVARASAQGGRLELPFDLTDVARNLREERYRQNGHGYLDRVTSSHIAKKAYYCLRPLMKVGVRRHLQKIRLNGWESIEFPRWPLDVSVDTLMKRTMLHLLRECRVERVPFVWFWPDGATTCAIMTHDVEGSAGAEFCEQLMDVDEAHDIKSAFQLVPQGREATWRQLARRVRARGFEVNLHDLNHDGRLFDSQPEFLQRAKQINRYAREFECDGFRSGAMYRRQDWYDAFEFAYDMSVPNVAHLEPQRGGCCTVMPYFVGNVLEIPLTTIQDYSLFHILDDYSASLWKVQIDQIVRHHGLMMFLAHPDYIRERRAFDAYVRLLSHLQHLRADVHVWVALPAALNRWWRSRREMALVRTDAGWRVTGPASHRARVAFASVDGDRLVYSFAA